MIPRDRLRRTKARHDELEALMAEGGGDRDDVTDLAREYAELTPVLAGIDRLSAMDAEIADLQSMLDDPDSDAEMRDLARSELEALTASRPDQERALMILLLPGDDADARSAILEVRAGTGGAAGSSPAGDGGE